MWKKREKWANALPMDRHDMLNVKTPLTLTVEDHKNEWNSKREHKFVEI